MRAASGFALCLLLAAPLRAQTTERVSVSSAGVEANGASLAPALSADGRFIVFASYAGNLVAGDTNGFVDVFVHDSLTGQTELVSVDSSGQQGNADSSLASPGPGSVQPGISGDGRFVVFQSAATNLFAGDTNGAVDVLLRDRLLGTTECVSRSSSGVLGNARSDYPAISADGHFVAFTSIASNLVPGVVGGVFVRDLPAGSTELVSVSTAGVPGSGIGPCLSADGRFVGFSSLSALAGVDTNPGQDVYVRDRLVGTTEICTFNLSGRVSPGISNRVSISADGRFVTFQSDVANLVAGDTNGTLDVFQRDRQTQTTARASLGNAGLQADSFSLFGCSSVDGRYVAFSSWATNLVPNDTNNGGDVFVHDMQSGTTERVSVDSFGNEVSPGSLNWSLSDDGRHVLFSSDVPNLVPGDGNGVSDIFVRSRSGLPVVVFCPGDGSSGACPCGNSGTPWRGCENSAGTGGARLGCAGDAALSNDTLVLTSSGELPIAPSAVLQGKLASAPMGFGDGLRCTSGSLQRLYVHFAVGGSVSAPQAADLSVSARSAAMGDTILPGEQRHYQVYYRDPQLGFCPGPQGDGWNISSGLAITWSQ